MITWAYVAGFLDGEGTVSARNRRVDLFQKEREVLDEISLFLNSRGVICTISLRRDRKHNNLGYLMSQHRLSVVDKPSVEQFLRNVRPYVVVKRHLVEDLWRYLVLYPRLPNSITGGLSSITAKHVSRTHKGKPWLNHRNQYSRTS